MCAPGRKAEAHDLQCPLINCSNNTWKRGARMAASSVFEEFVVCTPAPPFLRVKLRRRDQLVAIRLLQQPPADEATMMAYVNWYAAVYNHFAESRTKFAMLFDLSHVHGAPDIAFVNLKWRLTEILLPRTRIQVAGSVILVAPGAAALVAIVKSIFAQRDDEPARRVLTCDSAEAAAAIAGFPAVGSALSQSERAAIVELPLDMALMHAVARESCAL